MSPAVGVAVAGHRSWVAVVVMAVAVALPVVAPYCPVSSSF